MGTLFRQRLLKDIAELQDKPYPNISLHTQDENITKACLVLAVQGYGWIHLTVAFPPEYPLRPPRVEKDSTYEHPNASGRHICASILNPVGGYTPAYTLKGIAIQLMSFFGGRKLDRSDGCVVWCERGSTPSYNQFQQGDLHLCGKCGYSGAARPPASFHGSPGDYFDAKVLEFQGRVRTGSVVANPSLPTPELRSRQLQHDQNHLQLDLTSGSSVTTSKNVHISKPLDAIHIPEEILLTICEELDFEDLRAFSQSWYRIGELVWRYDMIRTRGMQCFCFKSSHMNARLGVGVAVVGIGKHGVFQSEFDLLSLDAYEDHNIRKSVLGTKFEHWLPLPISYGHWRKVNRKVATSLSSLGTAARLGTGSHARVIFHFMNDIVLQLNTTAEKIMDRGSGRKCCEYHRRQTNPSTLAYGTEKAIESYFHMFHLLLCMATARPSIVKAANKMIRSFIGGRTSKTDCPDLGHLLVATLITDIQITEKFINAIIRETITRNVVWMLDSAGAGRPELSYLEPSEISDYRLQETFTANKSSYRLLMFQTIFQRTAVGSPRVKSLAQLRTEAFERHGGPTPVAEEGLASAIWTIHTVRNFPGFFKWMGVEKPTQAWYTNFLRNCVRDSAKKGYHRMPITQSEALALRKLEEPNVEVISGLQERKEPSMSGRSFFIRNRMDGRGRPGRDRRERKLSDI